MISWWVFEIEPCLIQILCKQGDSNTLMAPLPICNLNFFCLTIISFSKGFVLRSNCANILLFTYSVLLVPEFPLKKTKLNTDKAKRIRINNRSGMRNNFNDVVIESLTIH